MSKKNNLINIVLCVCSLIFATGVAEYVLRRMKIEGLPGYKLYLRKNVKSEYDMSSKPQMIVEGKEIRFDDGNCYPSDPAGRLPIKSMNPHDGNYWYCVTYDYQQRRQGYHPDRQRQIAFVGDSFAFGDGVKETDTLGYLLNEYYPKINFQNWGKKGANINDVNKKCQEIIKSVPLVSEVIYFYNLNDVRMSKMINDRHEKLMIDFQNIRWSRNENRQSAIIKILSPSVLFSLTGKVLVIKKESSLTVQHYKDLYFSEQNRQEFLSTMDDIRSVKDMLAARGISFRMVIYPLLYKDILGRYPFESVHTAIMKACDARGILCLDGYVPFKSYYSLKRFIVHPLDYHPNGLCNRNLVDYLYRKNFIKDVY